MRYQLSVFALCVRTKFFKLLLTLVLMVGVAVAAFTLLGYAQAWNYGTEQPGMVILGCIFVTAYLVLALGCLGPGEKRTKSAYLLQRLQISERWVFLWDALAAGLCFLCLYTAQILTIFLLAALYQRSAAYTLGPQGIYVMLARNGLTHGLLPFGENCVWIRNVLFFVCAGLSTAAGRVTQRNGRRPNASIFTLGFLVTRFPTSLGGGSVSMLWLFVIFISTGIAVGSALMAAHPGKRRLADEETNTP